MIKDLSVDIGNLRDTGSIPRLGRFSGEGHGDPP